MLSFRHLRLYILCGAAALSAAIALAQAGNPAVALPPMVEAQPSAVVEKPEQFYGKYVEVQAPVARVFHGQAFALSSDEIGEAPLIVLLPSAARAVTENLDVLVQGLVRPLSRADLERDYPWFNYEWLSESSTGRGQNAPPVLVASYLRNEQGIEYSFSLDRSDFEGRLNESSSGAYGQRDPTGQAAERPASRADGSTRTQAYGNDRVIGAEIGRSQAPGSLDNVVVIPIPTAVVDTIASRLAENPAAYFGRHVLVRGRIESAAGENAFVLAGETGQGSPSEILVMAPRLTRPAPEGADVTVVGFVRKFVEAEFERDYNWFNRSAFTGAEIRGGLSGEPVIVASSVQTRSGADLIAEP